MGASPADSAAEAAQAPPAPTPTTPPSSSSSFAGEDTGDRMVVERLGSMGFEEAEVKHALHTVSNAVGGPVSCNEVAEWLLLEKEREEHVAAACAAAPAQAEGEAVKEMSEEGHGDSEKEEAK